MLLYLTSQFIMLAFIVYMAGIYVTKTTVKISKEIQLSDALGGLLILAIVTSLPEIAILWAASIHHEVGIGISNILGGIAIQTVLLCLFDFYRLDKRGPLSQKVSSLELMGEGLLAIFLLGLLMMGQYFPPAVVATPIPVCEIIILICWITGVVMIDRLRKSPQNLKETYPHSSSHSFWARLKKLKIDRTIGIFLFASILTLISGYYLEKVSSQLAHELGMDGVVFGATILALVTSLPEIATGLEALWLKHERLAVSDILGGNAFLPCLFLLPALYMGHSVVPLMQRVDSYLAALGIVLTTIYIAGMMLKSTKEVFHVGYDTMVILGVYGIAMVGLFFI